MQAGIELRHAGSGGWPHTGAYSAVQMTLSPTFTVAEVFASFPDELRTMMVTVYVPATEYACVNVDVCVNDSPRLAALDNLFSSSQTTRYVNVRFSGSLAWIVHMPTSFAARMVGLENSVMTGGFTVVAGK